MSKPKILILDIETSPTKAFTWGMWQEVTSYSFIERDWYILCWAAKWLGEKEVISSALPDFKKTYQADPENDKLILKELVKLLEQADIIVAHNGIDFDRKKINARLIINGITPPPPCRWVDTLKICRSEFAFTSNKLADVVQFLKVGKKLDTGGFQLWKDCLAGVEKAWALMVKYCKGDVQILEKVYLALRPYILQHPNLSIYLDSDRPVCPKCGSAKIQKRGYAFTTASKFQRFCCTECGGWGREKVNLIEKDKRSILTVNAC